MKQILLLGANGQVGQALRAEALPPDWQLTAYGRAECDIVNHALVQKTLREMRPDLIINTAAMTNVDASERKQDKAVAANFEAPANLAAQCSALDLPLIHLSTDFVFDGHDGGVPYKEDTPANPLNVYANTKLSGEFAVRNELAWHVILRVSSVFSAFGDNILTRMLATLTGKDEVSVVNDQISGPTYAPDIAKTLITIGSQILRGKHDAYGTFHYCGAPPATRFAFANAVMESFAAFTEKRPKILAAKTSDFPGFAERPAYSVLDCEKIRAIYGIEQKPWRDGIAEAINALRKEGKLPS